jgi:uncharacterized protein (TIGR03066 family)
MLLTSSLLCAALLVPSLADKPEDLIVGKWTGKQKVKQKDDKVEVEIEVTYVFSRDGTLKAEIKAPGRADPKTVTGKYKILDDKTMEMTITHDGKTMTEQGSYKLTKDTLTLTSKKGVTTELKRVKE